MKFNWMLKLTLLGSFTLWALAPAAFAQVALPSLDPTQPSYSPAVAGWRTQSSFYGSFGEGSGDRKLNNSPVYDLVSSTKNAGILVPFDSVSFEMATSLSSVTETNNMASNANGGLETQHDVSTMMMALGDREFVSLGLGSITETTGFTHDLGTEQTKTSGVSAGMSMRFIEWFYVGANYRKLTDVTQGLRDNRYTEVGFGMGALWGSSGMTQFSVEYADISSKDAATGTTGVDEQYHPSTRKEYIAMEWMMRGLLFTNRSWVEHVDYNITHPILGGNYWSSKTTNESGVLWVPPGGMSLGFYFTNVSEERESFVTSMSDFTIKAAYLF